MLIQAWPEPDHDIVICMLTRASSIWSLCSYPILKVASQKSEMATPQLTSRIPSSSESHSSPSSSSNLSGGKIAALILGTILAVGLVCLLLLYPQLVLTRLVKSRSRGRASNSGEVHLKDIPPQHPSRASGNDRGGNEADDAGSRKRYPKDGHGGSTQPQSNGIVVSRRSGSPVVINNNIYINSGDYLQPLPALNSQRTRGPALIGLRTSRNAQGAPGTQNFQFDPQANIAIPPHRRRNDANPASPLMANRSEQMATSNFWDVADWARGVAPGQSPRSPAPGSAGSSICEVQQSPVSRQQRSTTRAFDVPGTFPEDEDVMEIFQLVKAPERAHAPRAPSHGDNGFWVREARESRWRTQEQEDRRDRQEKEDRRERQEREERRERDRYEREERRERDRLEREERRERQERKERRERQEREDRRERQDELRRWGTIY